MKTTEILHFGAVLVEIKRQVKYGSIEDAVKRLDAEIIHLAGKVNGGRRWLDTIDKMERLSLHV